MSKDVKVDYFLKTKIEYQFFLTAEEQYLERRKRSSAKKKKDLERGKKRLSQKFNSTWGKTLVCK